eukprot:COSAG02_NODE_253_length_26942_cov_80.561152_12_plen_219_part_00
MRESEEQRTPDEGNERTSQPNDGSADSSLLGPELSGSASEERVRRNEPKPPWSCNPDSPGCHHACTRHHVNNQVIRSVAAAQTPMIFLYLLRRRHPHRLACKVCNAIQDGRTKYLIASCKLVGSLACCSCCSEAPGGAADAVGATTALTTGTTRAAGAPLPTATGVERFTARTTGAVGACRLHEEALDRRLGCGTSKPRQADPAAVQQRSFTQQFSVR